MASEEEIAIPTCGGENHPHGPLPSRTPSEANASSHITTPIEADPELSGHGDSCGTGSQSSKPQDTSSGSPTPGAGLRRSSRRKLVTFSDSSPHVRTSHSGGVKKSRRKPKSNAHASTEEWAVEKILDGAIDSETLEHSYLVKWKGCGREESTWEPKRTLAGCREAIRRFEERRGL